MAYLALALAGCTAGVALGFFALPPALATSTGFLLAMSALSLVLVFTARRWAETRHAFLFLLLFTLISGITLVPLLAYAGAVGGQILVLKAFGATTALYLGLALFGYTTGRDLSGFGGFLTAGLIGLIAVSLISLVLHFFGIEVWTSAVEKFVAGFGVLLFAGFTAYDFQNLKLQAGQIPPALAAVSLFLNFILLFQYVLRLMLSLAGNRD